MGYFLKDLLVRYGQDRGVWVAVATFLSHVISRKLGFTVDASMLTDFLVGLVAWVGTHWLHVTVVPNTVQVPNIENK